MQHRHSAEGSDGIDPTGCGVWLQPATIGDGKCSSATPCCDAAVEVPLADLQILGEVELHCPAPTCNKRWDLRFDPWAPGREALWID